MPIIIITLIAHGIFLLTDAYWLFLWLDIVVHFFMGAGLAMIFVKNFGWEKSMAIVAVIIMALGWEYVERLLGLSAAIIESLDDAVADVISGVVGGIIGSNYAKRK